MTLFIEFMKKPARNPRTLIESGIRRVVQQKFGAAFRFIRQ